MKSKNLLAAWLVQVIDEADLHKRSGWARVLGSPIRDVERWVTGQDYPSAEKLDAIVAVIKSYGMRYRSFLNRWAKLSKMPLEKVWSGPNSIYECTSANTLGDYIARHHRARLLESLDALSTEDQEAVCMDAIAECTKRILSRNDTR